MASTLNCVCVALAKLVYMYTPTDLAVGGQRIWR